MPETIKAGKPCPKCRDTKAGTLERHCPPQILHCDWLICRECRKFGRPDGQWLEIFRLKEQAS